MPNPASPREIAEKAKRKKAREREFIEAVEHSMGHYLLPWQVEAVLGLTKQLQSGQPFSFTFADGSPYPKES